MKQNKKKQMKTNVIENWAKDLFIHFIKEEI